MFKKILRDCSLLPIIILGSCTTYRGVPKAINKPKMLPLGETKRTAPITNVERDVSYAPLYTKSENEQKSSIRDVFDFSKYIEKKPAFSNSPAFEEDYNQNENRESVATRPAEDGVLRIAVLLPIETQNMKVAEDLKNAATMALFDAKSKNTILQFYDTNGTYDDAKEKAKTAVSEGADVIVGPLFAEEVKGASRGAGKVPVISFTTDTTALSGNVFSIGFLMEQQIKRIVEYAVQNGKSKFAIIVSDSESGRFVRDSFKKYVSQNNAELVADVKYNAKTTTDLMKAVKEVSNFDNRKAEYDEYKQSVKDRYDYLLKLKESNPTEYKNAFDSEQFLSSEDELSFMEKTLSDLEKKLTISEPEYDSIFIFGDDINNVLMIGSSLMYYDVHPDKIQYLGTSQLENPKVYSERAFRGAWYPSVSTKYSGKFDSAYKKYFNRAPIKIASLAYDAVSLVNSLGEDKGTVEQKDILNPNGWTGINGIFRFKYNGSSERNMDIKQVIGGAVEKTRIISPAQLNFLQEK